MEKVSFDIILNLKNNISRGLVNVKKQFDAIDKAGEQASATTTRFGNICSRLKMPDLNAFLGVAERLGGVLGDLSQGGMNFGQSMADLSSITGIAGDDLKALGENARKVGQDSGLGAGTAARAYAILASQIDVAVIGMAGLNNLQEKSVTLAQASGMSIDAAATSLAGTINQFGLSANEAERVINVLAAGSKYGAAEIEELSQSFKVAGSAASVMGLTVEQSAGALEVLSKANLKGSIDVAETTVEGGTLFGSGTIKSTQVSLNGGSIACKVTNDVKSGDLTLKASEFTVEKDAVCTIDNVQLNGADVSMDANTVWSDSNGKAVVYFQPASTVAFSIKAVTFTSSEETTDSITAKEQNYTYEDGNLKKGKSATAYTVKVGADLTTTYGEKLENVDIITVSAAKDYTPEVSLRDYDEAMDSSLELKDGTAKGYKVTKKNIKEKPDEKSFSLNEVLVTDTFGYDHILSGTVNYKIEKKELTPLISVNKTSTTSKNKATK